MLKEIAAEVSSIMADVQRTALRAREAWLEKVLRTKPKPPIKGPITAGKLRWRGLRLIGQHRVIPQGQMAWWVEQRGKRISAVRHEKPPHFVVVQGPKAKGK